MNKHRIPCPHCGESILPEAKKCRFCGERLDRKNSPSLRIVYWAWFLSMAAFLVSVFFVRRAPVSSATFWLIVLGLIVVAGVIAYLMLMTKVFGSLRTKNAKWYGLATLITFCTFFGVLFNFEKVEAKLGFTPPKVEQPVFSPAIMASPMPTSAPTSKPLQKTTSPTRVAPTNSNKITCTGPDGKTFKTTQEECDSFNQAWGNVPPPDPNEVISCNIHANCGGGSKAMTRASCEQITCCSLKSGNTLTSPGDCKNKQYNECTEAGMSAGLSLYYSMEACKQYK